MGGYWMYGGEAGMGRGGHGGTIGGMGWPRWADYLSFRACIMLGWTLPYSLRLHQDPASYQSALVLVNVPRQPTSVGRPLKSSLQDGHIGED